MRFLLLAPLAAAVLAGCQRSAPEPTPADQPAPAAASSPATPARSLEGSVASSRELIGEYRIAGVGGRDIDLPHGITARISDTAIHVTSDCVNLAWSWSFEAGRLTTERVPIEGCGRGLLPEEEAIAAVLDGAQAVARTSANGIEIVGYKGSVLLFSQ